MFLNRRLCNSDKIIYNIFNNILLLPAYWKPFTSPLPPGVTNKEYYQDIFHWLSKYLNNIVISGLIINNMINNSFHTSIYAISIASMVCFIISIFLLYFIILWNRENIFNVDFFYIRQCVCKKKDYRHKFKSFSLSCNCCCINQKESIENIDSEISTETPKINEIINYKEEIIA